MKTKPYLSVIIPAYNEEGNFKEGVLEEVYAYLRKQKYSWEALIVDDCSTDNTAEMASKFADKHQGFRLYKEPHRGKGGTVIAGTLKAKGKIVLFTDADQATPIDQVAKLLPEFEDNYDVAIGSRAGREGAPISRKLMAFGWIVIRSLILGLPFRDTQCGFKAFTRSAAKKIFNKLSVYKAREVEGAAVTAGFDLEVLYVAKTLGLKVAEVPVVWKHKGSRRVSFFKSSWQALMDLIQVRMNALSGKYKD